MKITSLKIINHTIHHTPTHTHGDRVVGPLDIYEEYNLLQSSEKGMPMAVERNGDELTGAFLVITTDEGVEGIHGPINYRAQLLVAVEGLAPHIIGRDPLETRLIWDIMSRFDRHSRAGIMLMAISAVDIALWDLKGKILGQPVYKLLGGGRDRLRPYASMLGHSIDLDEAKKAALAVKEKGIHAQKWFFRYGPSSGNEGVRKNLDLAFMLRETLGDDYELMFDCWMGWNISYALNIFRELAAVKPMWVEEVLRPHMKDGYRILKANTDIPLSAGEHLYLRQEVVGYLSEGIFRVIQSDPEWCGGITEALRIADLCEVYGTTFIPHGHSLMPAAHVVAAMSPEICPYVEYLIHFLEDTMLPFFDRKWLNDGYIYMGNTPGTGLVINSEILVRSEEVTP